MRVFLCLLAILAAGVSARAQSNEIQSFEVTPLVGVQLGRAFELATDQSSVATMSDAASYGVAAGVRFDDLSLIEIRWMRSRARVEFGAPFGRVEPATTVTEHQFFADFTREWEIREVRGLHSFLSGSLGLTHLGTAHDGFTRFSFGFGIGLKQFLGERLAIRAEAQWLPIVVQPAVNLGCFGGCIAVLSGTLVQQFQFGIGPVVRF